MTEAEKYMNRCLTLAVLGSGKVAPNPMVGAVLVYNGRIIGEGYHQQYGQAHAEVNCIGSVKDEDRHLIPESTLYVSLEPCAHFGKTPPCADLIIRNSIHKVVVACRDPFEAVNGKGIEKLKAVGVEVEMGVLEKESMELNKRFFTFHIRHRPYVILKWAETSDGKIAAFSDGNIGGKPLQIGNRRLLISNHYSNRLVHKWRSEEAAILVGTNTALVDDPELTTRLWYGRSPVRLVVDMELKLPVSLKLFDGGQTTIVFNTLKHTVGLSKPEGHGVFFYQVGTDTSLVPQVLNALYQMGIQSVLVEGGARLLQSFIDEDYWDEARVIVNRKITAENGLPSPSLRDCHEKQKFSYLDDTITILEPGALLK